MTDQPRTPSRITRVPGAGLDLTVTEYPAPGPPLVLLHGIGSRAVSWWPVIDDLAVHFHLYAPDLRGHGASDKPAAGYLPLDYADDLTALLDALRLARPRLLGHSLGGMVALAWAVRHPTGARAIALEDAALRGDPGSAPAFDDWLALNALSPVEAAAAYRRRYPDWSDADCQRRAESITATAHGVFTELRGAALAAAGADRVAPLAVIESPVLLVHGDRADGSMVVPEDAARFAATVPRARVACIPGGGHSLHRDHRRAFLDRVVPFLMETGR